MLARLEERSSEKTKKERIFKNAKAIKKTVQKAI